MIRTFKYRIKDRRAAKALRAHAFQVNQCWNWCVAQHRDVLDRYKAGAPTRKWLSYFDLAKTFKGYGKEIGLNQQTICSICEQWARNRSTRYRASYGSKRARGWVPFQKQSRQIEGNSVWYLAERYRWFGNKKRPLPADAKGGAFVEDALGRWWVCFHVEVADKQATGSGEIGIDLGLKALATCSDGVSIPAIQHYRQHETKLATAQRAHNRHRVKTIHARIANCRKDHLHKVSTELTARYALIAVGNVSAKKLAKTRMAKSVLDAGWSTFRAMLKYKSAGYVEVDERFTTQTCSSCGALPPERPRGIAGLGIREWDCSACGASHDRDVNAARNILAIALSAQRRGDESRRAA